MKRRWVPMSYNKGLDCWLVVLNNTGYRMNCGEPFELCIGKNYGIPCRLELGTQWYVVIGSEGVKLNLRKDQTYKININY
ncbi:DUF5348 domain-containing protein [Bacillus sp. REN16]|uniref:DUF5348 domain-containing protein n=1 Tax=Bacillus sp. REN16 TaxID=2887296 RepID=UPI001E5C2538|nr:DUF5348 domain-containing protein [Bacillus sp. REN16]MCC3359729.1 DUF5348 domain-containing protein [Bacillus sp. REN16]